MAGDHFFILITEEKMKTIECIAQFILAVKIQNLIVIDFNILKLCDFELFLLLF